MSTGQIVGGAVGAVGGFIVGGPYGAYVGFSAGYAIGGMVDPPEYAGNANVEQQLQELQYTTFSRNTAVPVIFGLRKVAANVVEVVDFWHETVEVELEGGKGGSPPAQEIVEYHAKFVLAFCEGPSCAVSQLILNGKPVSFEQGWSWTILRGDDEQDSTSPSVPLFQTKYNYRQTVCVLVDGNLGQQATIPRMEAIIGTSAGESSLLITKDPNPPTVTYTSDVISNIGTYGKQFKHMDKGLGMAVRLDNSGYNSGLLTFGNDPETDGFYYRPVIFSSGGNHNVVPSSIASNNARVFVNWLDSGSFPATYPQYIHYIPSGDWFLMIFSRGPWGSNVLCTMRWTGTQWAIYEAVSFAQGGPSTIRQLDFNIVVPLGPGYLKGGCNLGGLDHDKWIEALWVQSHRSVGWLRFYGDTGHVVDDPAFSGGLVPFAPSQAQGGPNTVELEFNVGPNGESWLGYFFGAEYAYISIDHGVNSIIADGANSGYAVWSSPQTGNGEGWKAYENKMYGAGWNVDGGTPKESPFAYGLIHSDLTDISGKAPLPDKNWNVSTGMPTRLVSHSDLLYSGRVYEDATSNPFPVWPVEHADGLKAWEGGWGISSSGVLFRPGKERIWLQSQLGNFGPVTPTPPWGSRCLLTEEPRDVKVVRNADFDNPALAVFHLLTNTRWGMGIQEDFLDVNSFFDVADYCDVVLPGGGKRFSINYAMTQQQPALEHLKNMLAVFGGFLITKDEKIALRVDRDVSPSMSFGMDDIVEDSFGFQAIAYKDRPNQIKVEFHDARDNWRPNFAIADDALRQARDGRVVTRHVPIYGITSASQAARRAWFILHAVNVQTVSATFKTTMRALQLDVGDVIQVTHTLPGWNDKLFRVTSIELDDDYLVSLAMIEHDPSIYTDDEGATTLGTGQELSDISSAIVPLNVANLSVEQTYSGSNAVLNLYYSKPADSKGWDGAQISLTQDGLKTVIAKTARSIPSMKVSAQGIQAGSDNHVEFSVDSIGESLAWTPLPSPDGVVQYAVQKLGGFPPPYKESDAIAVTLVSGSLYSGNATFSVPESAWRSPDGLGGYAWEIPPSELFSLGDIYYSSLEPVLSYTLSPDSFGGSVNVEVSSTTSTGVLALAPHPSVGLTVVQGSQFSPLPAGNVEARSGTGAWSTSPTINSGDDIELRWNARGRDGYGMEPYGQEASGYSFGTVDAVLDHYTVEILVNDSVVRTSGPFTDAAPGNPGTHPFSFTYTAADNVADNTTYQTRIVLRIVSHGTVGVTTTSVEVATL